jgi:hypothetical protein
MRRNKNMTALHFTESIGRSPLRYGLLLKLVMLACSALSPAREASAVSPAPDGGYPGNNTAEGTSALSPLTSGISNTAVGFEALYLITTGSYNTANGADALRHNRGAQNTGTGSSTLTGLTVGSYNTANGYGALIGNGSNTSNNTAIGNRALTVLSSASENTVVGVSALASNGRGTQNTAVGFKALDRDFGRGHNNIGLGYEAGIDAGVSYNIETGTRGGYDNYTTRIGDGQTRTFMAGISGTAVVGDTVVVNGNGRLGTATSSARFKKEIRPIDKASEATLAFKPVSFQYKSDTKATPQFGLIAEEVAKVNPDLVTRDREGEIYSVRYEAVNAMLLNEFLKQHQALLEEQRKVQEQQATITRLKSAVTQQQKDFQEEVAQLTARLDEQASQIQGVSAQFEASKQTPQMVSDNQ